MTLNFSHFRHFATAQAMQGLEEASRRWIPDEKWDFFDICLGCDYKKPRIAEYYQKIEKEKK